MSDSESSVVPSTEMVALVALPYELGWQVRPVRWSAKDGKRLMIEAGPRTDLFVDPGGRQPVLNAPRLLGSLEGDFSLSTMLTVEFAASFDAGALLVHDGDRSWAKLCFEYSPQGQPTVVSVVTRGVSDDANAMTVEANAVWLRIARSGSSYAFHASTDGTTWQFVRHFALETEGVPKIGFVVQSPTGNGCSVTFEDIRFEPRGLADLRNGE